MAAMGSAAGRARRDLALWAALAALLAGTVAAGIGGLRLLLGVPDPVVPWVFGGLLGVPVVVAALLWAPVRRAAPAVFPPTFVGCGLFLLVLAVYLVVVAGLSGGVPEAHRPVAGLSLAAGLMSLVLVGPARARLRASARRRVADGRPRAREVLETFTTRMTRAVPMDELLLQLAELLRAAMGQAGAQVWTGSGGALERVVSVPDQSPARISLTGPELAAVSTARVSGNAWARVWLPQVLPAGATVRVAPVTHLGELRGLLVVARSRDDPGFTDDDDRVMVALARQLGLALHNVALDAALASSLAELQERNAELQASRARIVAATDASRRRIERDLHDGAQQHLLAMAVKLGLLGRLTEGDPAAVPPLLAELRGYVQAALTELRELAHGIYPPRLRDHGLADALRAAATRTGLPTAVAVTTRRRFDPSIEAAVYFCCLEAMQNADKHAGRGATLRVRVEEDGTGLVFTVTDTGAGFDPGAAGESHGFVHMRDRVGALGGTLSVDSAPGRGTRVRGLIDLSARKLG